MSRNVAIKLEGIEKSFKLPKESTNSLKRAIVNYFKGIKGYTTQHVLNGVSFDIEKGDFFGIVGKNGSGKSTLLKIISQIYTPEKGQVHVDGTLVSFIELGVGFNPELTGKENVYLNGAMLGFTRSEIDGFYQDIVDFSELEPFMNQKLKNYSSGMQVRLAFAVAIQAKSDILILDEVLAVGDEAFQRKCHDYFMSVKNSGKTIVLVTHSMDAVKQYCTKALFLEKGQIKLIGSPDEVANQYSLANMRMRMGNASSEGVVSDISVSAQELPDNQLAFTIRYTLQEDMQTYVTFSLVDINRNMILVSDNSSQQMTSDKGKQVYRYTVDCSVMNACQLKWTVTVKNDQQVPIAFYQNEDDSWIIPARKIETIRDIDASHGVIDAKGQWELEGESYA